MRYLINILLIIVFIILLICSVIKLWRNNVQENYITTKTDINKKPAISQIKNGKFTLYSNNDKSSKMKIAVLVLLIGDKYKKFVEISIKRKMEYCKMHKYDLIICNENLIPKNSKKHLVWSKIPFVLKFIKNYDWIFCSDADTLINREDIKLENIISENPNKDLILNEDDLPKGWKEKGFSLMLNENAIKQMYKSKPLVTTSDFLLKNTDWSINILKKCLLLKEQISNNIFKNKYSKQYFNDLQEQSYLNYLILKEKDDYNKIKIYKAGNRFSSPFLTFDDVSFFLIDFQGIRGPLLKEILTILDKYQTNKNMEEIKGVKKNSLALDTFLQSDYCKNFKKMIKTKQFENKWNLGDTKKYHKNILWPAWCQPVNRKRDYNKFYTNLKLKNFYSKLNENYKNLSPKKKVKVTKDYIFYNNHKNNSPKILMILILVGKEYTKIVMPCVKTKILYCKKHGYDLYISRKSLNKTRHLSWSKIPLILQNIDKYDWIYATDADTYIQLPNIKISDLITDKHKLYLNTEIDFSKDWSSGLQNIFTKVHRKKFLNVIPLICCSEFIVKGKDKWTKKFLTKVYDINYDSMSKFFKKKIYGTYFRNLMEQGAINYFLMINNKDRNNTKVFNSKTNFSHQFGRYTKKSFIIDFQGIRGELLKEMIKIVIDKNHPLHLKDGNTIMKNMDKSDYCQNRVNPKYQAKFDKNDKWILGNNELYDKKIQWPEFCVSKYLDLKKNEKRGIIPLLIRLEKQEKRDKDINGCKNFIVVIPMNGLTDRIGTILSWKILAEQLGKSFFVYWDTTDIKQFSKESWGELFNNKLGIKFINKMQLEKLKTQHHTYIKKTNNIKDFKKLYNEFPINDIKFEIYLKSINNKGLSFSEKEFVKRYNKKKNFKNNLIQIVNEISESKKNIQKIYKSNIIYNGFMSIINEPSIKYNQIVDYNNYANNMRKYLKLVKPIPKLQKKINIYANKHFDKNTIGVHIRRGDLYYLIKDTGIKLMTDTDYIKLINNEIKKNKNTKIFLATDSKMTIQKFKKIYPKRLIHYGTDYKHYFDTNWKSIKTEKNLAKKLNVAPKTNQQYAVIDLFLLSKTNKIIGEGNSGFSNLASKIGKIELITISEKQKLFFD